MQNISSDCKLPERVPSTTAGNVNVETLGTGRQPRLALPHTNWARANLGCLSIEKEKVRSGLPCWDLFNNPHPQHAVNLLLPLGFI